jgi:predicted DNA-binding ribbon-helix-helix protein
MSETIAPQENPERPRASSTPLERRRRNGETQHRVVQLDGRRYSLNLERPFWQTLEDIAQSRHLRLNRLIAQIAAGRGETNLASRVRAYCVAELRQRLIRALLSVGPTNIVSLLEYCPFPCLVLSRDQEVLCANAPFMGWFGNEGGPLVGQALRRHFRFRLRGNFDDLWASFVDGRVFSEDVRLISIAPGRVRAANATIQPAQVGGPGDFACLVWLKP